MIAIWGNKAHLTYGRWGPLHSLRISGGPSNNFQRRETHSANFFNNNPVDDFGEHDPAKESENHLRLGETIPAKPSPTNKNSDETISDEQELRRNHPGENRVIRPTENPKIRKIALYIPPSLPLKGPICPLEGPTKAGTPSLRRYKLSSFHTFKRSSFQTFKAGESLTPMIHILHRAFLRANRVF